MYSNIYLELVLLLLNYGGCGSICIHVFMFIWPAYPSQLLLRCYIKGEFREENQGKKKQNNINTGQIQKLLSILVLPPPPREEPICCQILRLFYWLWQGQK